MDLPGPPEGLVPTDPTDTPTTGALSREAALLAAALSSDGESSSSLSDPDDSLDSDGLDDDAMSVALSLQAERDAEAAAEAEPEVEDEADAPGVESAENDSEAETERIEPSPEKSRALRSAVADASDERSKVAADTPSKGLKTAVSDGIDKGEEEDDEDDGDDEDEEADQELSIAKPTITLDVNSATASAQNEEEDADAEEEDSKPTDALTETIKKRKRSPSLDHTESGEVTEDEPPHKRLEKIVADSHVRAPGSPLKISETVEERATLDEEIEEHEQEVEQELRLQSQSRGGKRTKKVKRRTRSTRHTSNDGRNGSPFEDGSERELQGGDAVDGTEDAGAVMRTEEDAARRKTAAMEALSNLEKQFMLMKDRVYDERIGKYQKELDQLLNNPEEHAEYQEYMRIISEHRSRKDEHERLLFTYRLKSLCIKSEVDRVRIHSSFYQNVRDIRERHLDDIAAMHYRLTQDRFQSSDACPDYVVPFPTRRSQQILQQAAYNKEVSILAGVARYVGFPAAPDIAPARPSEAQDDLEKMGVVFETALPPQPLPIPHQAFIGLSPPPQHHLQPHQQYLHGAPLPPPPPPQYYMHPYQNHQAQHPLSPPLPPPYHYYYQHP